MILAFLNIGLPTGSFILSFCSATTGSDSISVAKSHLIRSRWPVSAVCRRTDRPGSCTSTETSSSTYFCPLIELSGIIIQSLWTNVPEFASEKHTDITRSQIRWAESCFSRVFPKCLPVHSHTKYVQICGTVVRRRSQTRHWTPRSDVKNPLFCFEMSQYRRKFRFL
jgi:hypothetical protein